jgi:sugar lactone lactonase YvrE
VAFVHALNLKNQFAICIELPSGEGDFETLKQYSLTLAPDGKKLYAANTALGVVAEVTLDMANGVAALTRQASFPAQPHTPDNVAISALSTDGLLYFTDGEDVWPYATKTGAVLSPYRVSGPIIGLGTNPDGKRLFVVRAGTQQPMLVLDTASGRIVSELSQ